MLNPKAVPYLDYSFDTEISLIISNSKSSIIRYCGIYNSNILLFQFPKDLKWRIFTSFKSIIDIKTLPTINELNFIFEQSKKYPKSLISIALPKSLPSILHIDDLYYFPRNRHYDILFTIAIHRIPIYIK